MHSIEAYFLQSKLVARKYHLVVLPTLSAQNQCVIQRVTFRYNNEAIQLPATGQCRKVKAGKFYDVTASQFVD